MKKQRVGTPEEAESDFRNHVSVCPPCQGGMAYGMGRSTLCTWGLNWSARWREAMFQATERAVAKWRAGR